MTRWRPLLAVAVLAVVVVAGTGAGCKSDEEDPGDQFIARYCDFYKPCCAAAGLPDDGAACAAIFASTRSPEARFRPAESGHCIAGLEAIAGQPGFCQGDLLPPSSCAQVFGGVAAGTCLQDADCPPSDEGEARCISGGTQTPKCQIQARGQLDSTPCVGEVRGGVVLYGGTASGEVPDLGYLCDAADALRCDTSNTGACVALAAIDAPCTSSNDCAESAFCDATTGMCAARKAAGTACIDQAGECEAGTFCDVAAGMVCAAQLDVGAYCSAHGQCQTGNCPDGTCQPTPTGGANPLCGG
jgi:hypothetical protein